MSRSLDEARRAAEIDRGTLEVWIEQRWICPADAPGGAGFSDRDVARARLILDLRTTFGVNDEGIDVILHLVDQLHGLREAMAALRDGSSRA